VHGGVVDQVQLAFPELKAALLHAYAEASNQRLQLTFTGHSLGGSYAVTFALRALADDDLRPILLKQRFQVLTFGAPRVVYQAREETGKTGPMATMAQTPVYPAVPPLGGGELSVGSQSEEPSPNRPTATPWHSLAPGRVNSLSFFNHHFLNIINDQDVVPRLLGNRIAGSSLAVKAIHTLAKPLLSLHVAAAEIETKLEHFTHVGAVIVLDDDGGLVQLPTAPGVADGFFSTRPAWQHVLRNHRTGEYELRVQRALVGRVVPVLESAEETETEASEDAVMAQLLAQAEL
jgi:hypothetical protein